MAKRILALFLTAALMLNAVPWAAVVSAVEEEVQQTEVEQTAAEGEMLAADSGEAPQAAATDGWTWSLEGTVLTISGTGAMGDYDQYIPAPWGDSVTEVIIQPGITAIGDYAFYSCSRLTQVIIPENVESIGNYAFAYCQNLTQLQISEGVRSIEARAFSYCTGLTSLTVPESVTRIGENAFEYCYALKTVDIRSASGDIQGDIFYGCNAVQTMTFAGMSQTLTGYFGVTGSDLSVKSVTVTGGVIPASAFKGITALTSVTLSEGVTAIGNGGFSGCTGISWINIPGSVKTVGTSAFSGCTGLKTVAMESGVAAIGNQAFRGCSALISIDLPDSVTTVEASAFLECDKLTYHVEGVGKYLGNSENPIHALAGVTDTTITAFQISDRTGLILDKAFYNCTKLQTVSIPDTVTSIGSYAFYNCSVLTGIDLPDDITAIWSHTFYGCKKLTKITIPQTVVQVGMNAFQLCSGLTRVDISDLGAWCAIDFENNYANPLMYAKRLYLNGVQITRLDIPQGTEKICSYAFYNGSFTSVSIPDSVAELEAYAFQNCTGLTEVVVPESVSTMGSGVFSGCSALKAITIPFVGQMVRTASEYPRYPMGYIFGSTSYTGGTATSQTSVVGSGYSQSSTYYIPTSLRSVTVTGGSILSGAFNGCANLTSITLADGVGGIGASAFYGCKGLTQVNIPASATAIGGSAFYNCSKLAEMVIPDSVESIGANAFQNCTSLKKLTVGSGVTKIDSFAFSGCTGLTEVAIPESVTELGNGAFAKCANLETITLPFVGGSRKTADSTYQYPLGYIFGTTSYTGGTLTKQYYYGSSKTSTTYSNYYIPAKLKTVTVTDGDLLYGAFYGCKNITAVRLGAGVLNVNPDAFIGADGLEAVEAVKDNPNYSSEYRCLYNKDKTLLIWTPANHTYILTVGFTYANGDPIFETVTEKHKAGAAYTVEVPEVLGYFSRYDSVSGTMPSKDLTVDVVYYENDKLAEGPCTETIRWTLYDDGALIFRGTGKMPDYTSGGAPWAELSDKILSVYIDPRITSIGAYAFENCGKLFFIDYGYSVASIGAYAFAGCTALTSFKLPGSVTAISEGAFSGCSGIKTVAIPDNITTVADNAFAGCTALERVSVGGAVTGIGSNAFHNCGKLTQVYFRGEPAELGENALGSTQGKYVYYYSTVALWEEQIQDSLWHGYTAVPYNTILKAADKSAFTGTNVYIIKVVDRYNQPLANAVVDLGGNVQSTNADGMVYYIKPTQALKLTVSCSEHITFADDAFVASATQTMDIIELSDRPSTVQGVSLNGSSIATSVRVLNCAQSGQIRIAVRGYSKYTIIKYELRQGDRVIATEKTDATSCTFTVSANAFEEGQTVLVRMYTADGYMVAAALNIDVIKLASVSEKQILGELDNIDLNVTVGDLGGLDFKLPFDGTGNEKIYTMVQGRTIRVGINLDVKKLFEKPDTPMAAIQKKVDEAVRTFAELDRNVDVKFCGYIEIEYLGNDQYYIKNSYVKLSVGISVSAKAQASLLGIVGVYFEISLGASGTLELKIARFDPESGFEMENVDLTIESSLGVEGGAFLLAGAGSAGVYGELVLGFTIGIVPQTGVEQVYVTGELGATWSLLWGLAKGKHVIAQGDIYRWPEEMRSFSLRLLEAQQDPGSYEMNDRGYLESRTDWQGSGDHLQKSIYGNVAPKTISCGNTTLMVWLDDNAQRANADYQTLYYSLYESGCWSAPVAVDDNGTFDCEFDVCTDGSRIYVIYTELQTRQSDAAMLDVADESGIEALAGGVEVNVAVYENGSFGDPVRLTDNSVCELLPRIAVINGVPTATWLESNAVGLNTDSSGSTLCTAELGASGWGESEALATGQNAVSDITNVSLQGVAYTAYIVDADGDPLTKEDQALILSTEGADPVQLDSGLITEVDSAVVCGTAVLTWSKGGKLYMVAQPEQQAVCLMPEAVVSASKFRILPLSEEQSLLLFVMGNYDGEGNAVDGTDIYSVYINEEGCRSSAVRMTETEGYIAAYSVSYIGGRLVTVFTETFANVTDGDVETLSHLRNATLDFCTDLIIDSVAYDVTGAQPGAALDITVGLRNGGMTGIDGVTVNVYDSTGVPVYAAEQTLSLESGGAMEHTVTVALPQSIREGAYRLELMPWCGSAMTTDADPDNNSAELVLAYADIGVSAEQKIIGEKNYIILSVANSGNTASKAMLQVYAPNETGKLLGEIETDIIAPGDADQYLMDIHALVTDADTMVTCTAAAATEDPFRLNNTDTVALFHVEDQIFVTDPEKVIYNPELAENTAAFDKYAPEDIAVQITAEAESFSAIEGLTAEEDYTFIEEGRISLSSGYLTGLELGSHTLQLLFDFGYEQPVARGFTVVVEDSTPIPLTGSLTISGEPIVGGSVYADLSELKPSAGEVIFRWCVDGVQVSTDADYTVTPQDLGKELSLTVTGTNGYSGTFEAKAVVGLYQPPAPAKPVVAKVENDRITVVKVAGVEYSLDEHVWQDANVFTGLEPGSSYTVYARVKATQTSAASPVSLGASVTTAGGSEDPTPTRFSIAGVNLALNNDITLYLYLMAENYDPSYTMEITKSYADGREVTKTVAAADWENYYGTMYRVGFNGIAAKEMTDEITVTVYDASGNAVSKEFVTTVADAAVLVYKNEANARSFTMMADLLNYGAAAQGNFRYHTDDLANTRLTAEQAAYASARFDMSTVTGKATGTAGAMGTTLYLNTNIQHNFFFDAAVVDSTMTAKVSYTNYKGNAKSFTISGSEFTANGSMITVNVSALTPADVNVPVTVQIVDANGAEVCSLTDSIAWYCVRAQASATNDLFIELMEFATSCNAYFG